ncbi:MAG: gephyrin-like molybdotransferase Glp [Trueperaceae bacterium]|nr:gephyrin-like molybdotransferase Glp [Trueperaceae bacterium]
MADAADHGTWNDPPVQLERAITLLEEDGRRAFAARDAELETVPLGRATGRILARDLAATCDHPNVDDASLDGIACRADDASGASDTAPVALRIVGESAAGRPFSGRVGPGEAIRIQTGAAVPDGANAIVPVERLRDDGEQVVVFAPASEGAVRPRGQDVRAGQIGLRAGRRMDAATIALAAAMGHAELPVRAPLRVALLTGGDEVVPPGSPLGPGDVFDANGPALTALILAAGAEPLPLPPVRDDLGALEAALDTAPHVDLLLTCGGISMGRYDRARDLLRAHGRLSFRKVLLKPGGPATFAHLRDRPWLALPGNPVSASVTFLVLARAWLDRAAGRDGPLPYERRVPAFAGAPLRSAGDKTTLLRVVLEREDHRLVARPAGDQNSGVVRTLAAADALAIVPPSTELSVGDAVDVVPLAPHLG